MKGDVRIGFAMKALIVKDGNVLILKKSVKEEINPKTWDFPGGRLGFREDPEQSLLREVMEETALSVRIVRPLNVWTMIKEKEGFQLVGVNYLCEWIDGEPIVSHEHDFAKWVDFEELLNNEEYPDGEPNWEAKATKQARKSGIVSAY